MKNSSKHAPTPRDINPEITGMQFPQIKLPPKTPVVIEPKGPRLNISAILNHVLFDMGDETKPTEEGGIYVGARRDFSEYKVVEVLSVGPDVKCIRQGMKVLLPRVTHDPVIHDGHKYWRTQEPAVIGIVDAPPVPEKPASRPMFLKRFIGWLINFAWEKR